MAQEKTSPKSRFMSVIRKFFIKWHTTKPYTPQHNKAEYAIHKLKKRVKARKAKFGMLSHLWDFLYKYESELLSMIPRGYEAIVPR